MLMRVYCLPGAAKGHEAATHYNVHLFFIIDTERAGEGSWQREIEPDVYKSYLLYEDALL